jgi:hypothetical protein
MWATSWLDLASSGTSPLGPNAYCCFNPLTCYEDKNMSESELALAETQRLAADSAREDTGNWKRWGAYLSERQWGTVREDYSPNGTCWDYFPHDHARSRAYRWGEDGLMGITDRECRLCFAWAFWNERDPILKERLFGLTGPEGNHGEDVKEEYFYLESTPTHSYMKALYKYPQAEFPYDRLVAENHARGRDLPEFEITDTGIFDESRYFDLFAEYAKNSANDILIRLTIANRGPEPARLHVLPTVWFRNTWSWGCTHEGCWTKPRIVGKPGKPLKCFHATLGVFNFAADVDSQNAAPPWLVTENETNYERIFGSQSATPFQKDAFHKLLIEGQAQAVNPELVGTKAAAHYVLEVPAGGEVVLKLRLWSASEAPVVPIGSEFDQIFAQRIAESQAHFQSRHAVLNPAEQRVVRQAEAGLLWSKQFYHYVVEDWLKGDPGQPPVAESRTHGRNADWGHLFNRDVISMPDKWEYPWYAAWDLAFHMIPFSKLDAEFSKEQLLLFLREWYMHPNGQIPAYEFALGDVNPPVHAWACWRVYKMTAARGQRDHKFLARAFHKLLLNFTWWVNRKDPSGQHLFSGGFLGLDNIGVFDRSKPLPTGGSLEQADGTAWMAFYCITMQSIALELAVQAPEYEDVASKFFEHFVAIVHSMNTLGGTGLWDENDGFYYDHLRVNGTSQPLRIRSIVGIIPLFAVSMIKQQTLKRLPGFRKRMEWFLKNRPELAQHVSSVDDGRKAGERLLLAIPTKEQLVRILRRILDESEFLSPHGIRSMSRAHCEKPFTFQAGDDQLHVEYVPGESNSGMFGGNSNWRGPVWFPVNFLLIEALERYHHFYRDGLQIECPTGSGKFMNLAQVACELTRRLTGLFLPDASGQRPCHGSAGRFFHDPHWKDLVTFHEYFHGDDGHGLGASHQTGWTALCASLIRDMARDRCKANEG